jgi:hypothetical protein
LIRESRPNEGDNHKILTGHRSDPLLKVLAIRLKVYNLDFTTSALAMFSVQCRVWIEIIVNLIS